MSKIIKLCGKELRKTIEIMILVGVWNKGIVHVANSIKI